MGPIETQSIRRFLGRQTGDLPQGAPGAPLFGILVEALLRPGHRLTLVTTDSQLMTQGRSTVSSQLSEDGNLRIFYCPIRRRSFAIENGRLGRMWDFFRFERKAMCEVLREVKPDVVHAHWSYEYALAGLESGLPVVVTCHDSPRQVLRFMPNLYRLGRYAMARKALRKARVLTAVSPYLQSELEHFASVPIRVIANPMPDECFESDPSGVERGAANALAPRVVMILNGWTSRKNPEPALIGFSQFRRSYPKAELHCFGADFGPGEVADSWLQSRGVADGVALHGRQPHSTVLKELKQATMMVHPALEESCCMAIVEAMSLGIPVIGGAGSGGVPWQLDDGKAGLVVDVRSAEAISGAMNNLAADELFRQRTASAGFLRAKQLFSSSHVAAQYVESYREAVGLPS